jgi:hypothetical protein
MCCALALVPFLLVSIFFSASEAQLYVGFYAWLAGILLVIYRDLWKGMARIVGFILNWG